MVEVKSRDTPSEDTPRPRGRQVVSFDAKRNADGVVCCLGGGGCGISIES